MNQESHRRVYCFTRLLMSLASKMATLTCNAPQNSSLSMCFGPRVAEVYSCTSASCSTLTRPSCWLAQGHACLMVSLDLALLTSFCLCFGCREKMNNASWNYSPLQYIQVFGSLDREADDNQDMSAMDTRFLIPLLFTPPLLFCLGHQLCQWLEIITPTDF